MLEQGWYTLASCNMEGDKHILRIKDFLMAHSPDVVCFQEAPEADVIRIADQLNYSYTFRGNAIFRKESIPGLKSDKTMGLAILSHLPIVNLNQFTYAGDPNVLPIYKHHEPNSRRREVLYVDLPGNLRIATTHFTWAPNGGINDEQKRDIQKMLKGVQMLGECVFSGDFNFPRPNELYQIMTSNFSDQIPEKYLSSLDPYLSPHADKIQLMVDYIFSTPMYDIQSVQLITGVSDHQAILALFSKK